MMEIHSLLLQMPGSDAKEGYFLAEAIAQKLSEFSGTIGATGNISQLKIQINAGDAAGREQIAALISDQILIKLNEHSSNTE